MSGPMVAGIVALMLEANPVLSATQAKEILKVTARLDTHTGNIDYANGDLQWGWGKANALAAVKAAETLANIPEITLKESLFQVYPNPTTNTTHVKLLSGNLDIQHIEVIGLDGRSMPIDYELFGQTATLSFEKLPAGTYLIKLSNGKEFGMKKIIKQ